MCPASSLALHQTGQAEPHNVQQERRWAQKGRMGSSGRACLLGCQGDFLLHMHGQPHCAGELPRQILLIQGDSLHTSAHSDRWANALRHISEVALADQAMVTNFQGIPG